MPEDVEAAAKDIVARAERRALSALSRPLRCALLALKQMSLFKYVEPSELEAALAALGARCGGEQTLRLLERYGMVEARGGVYGLSAAGSAAASMMDNVVDKLVEIVARVLGGDPVEDDVMALLLGPFASAVGMARSYVEEPGAARFYMAIHMYVSGLCAGVAALLARVDARVLHLIDSM